MLSILFSILFDFSIAKHSPSPQVYAQARLYVLAFHRDGVDLRLLLNVVMLVQYCMCGDNAIPACILRCPYLRDMAGN